MKHTVIALALAVGFSVNVSAAPIITYGGAPHLPSSGSALQSAVAGAVMIDFDGVAVPRDLTVSPLTAGAATYSGQGRILVGSIPGSSASPPLDNRSNYLAVPIPGGTVPGTVAIDFSSAANYFGLFWGSIDQYNSIRFLSRGLEVALFGGADLPTPTTANGCQTCDSSNLYVNFEFGPDAFDRIEIKSTGRAFESDLHAYRLVGTPFQIPEPAPLAVLGLALMGLALVRTRRR